jgi:hypothetical protein
MANSLNTQEEILIIFQLLDTLIIHAVFVEKPLALQGLLIIIKN